MIFFYGISDLMQDALEDENYLIPTTYWNKETTSSDLSMLPE